MFDAIQVSQLSMTEDGARAICGPIALSIACATRDAEDLAGQGHTSTVFCRLEFADEQLTLLGFSTIERRSLYEALRRVAGIGRRSALAILDCGEVLDTLRAVAGDDHDYFRAVPGLGPKRIGAVVAELERGYRHALPRPLPVPVGAWVEARDALLQTGVEFSEAEEELRRACTAHPGVQDATGLLEAASSD